MNRARRLELRGEALSAYAQRREFADDVRAGLCATPKRLSCRFFYDHEGSLLFEKICALPEYYIPSAESEILQAHASELAATVTASTIVELGSGSATKTRILLEAFLARRNRVRYVPVDLSRTMLEASSRALLADYPRLEVLGIAAEYHEGLAQLEAVRGGPILLLWLGSNIGNFARPEAAAFLTRLRERMRPDDRMLLGVDLRKDVDKLQLAYDDPGGVTAAFNLNLLARLNRELGGDVDLQGFAHRASWDADAGCMRIHIVSRRAQRVRLAALGIDVDFAAGEAVHTEDSYKYSAKEIESLCAAAGLRVVERWSDQAGLFCECLVAPG